MLLSQLAFSATVALLAAAASAYNLPASPIYGVNLGGWLVAEPWMLPKEWARMGSASAKSERALMSLNLPGTQRAFKEHWDSWLTEQDIKDLVHNHGINTFRIPLGHWIVEKTTTPDETFPKGGYQYLVRALGWIRNARAYAILDLHGAPGGQADNPFTGQTGSIKFYTPDNYERALLWARNMTRLAHKEGRGVVMGIEAVNEPLMDPKRTPGLGQYYLDFASAVREEEATLQIPCGPTRVGGNGPYEDCLNLVFMDQHWQYSDENNPANACIGHCIYDSHDYACFGGPSSNDLRGYLGWFCNDNRNQQDQQKGNYPVFTGEYSLCNSFSASNSELQTLGQAEQFTLGAAYGAVGWIYWNFKVEAGVGDPWDYRVMVDQGILPRVPGTGDPAACSF
ncbi:family 5 hypothetical beta glucosidase from glycoside dehydrogenase [Geranomyces variabilis]|nr:family 5 hypothetical beta glucosidase from glycoside dehydrogenase [Geranomyces variabilis]KAJ3136526.1 hypothetical protein HDU90_003239 [Geranomyces variabilis]